jgi:wyosine [tRNA(Phe)-imidazoG37] synthetase (radical SAM superfamily)
MVFKGFSNTHEGRILYLKIHGSLNWKEHNDTIVKTLEEGKSTDVNITRHLWIPPTLYGKSLDDNPYSEIFNKFRQEMKEADLCLTIGYSFRDKLVNE